MRLATTSGRTSPGLRVGSGVGGRVYSWKTFSCSDGALGDASLLMMVRVDGFCHPDVSQILFHDVSLILSCQ